MARQQLIFGAVLRAILFSAGKNVRKSTPSSTMKDFFLSEGSAPNWIFLANCYLLHVATMATLLQITLGLTRSLTVQGFVLVYAIFNSLRPKFVTLILKSLLLLTPHVILQLLLCCIVKAQFITFKSMHAMLSIWWFQFSNVPICVSTNSTLDMLCNVIIRF